MFSRISVCTESHQFFSKEEERENLSCRRGAPNREEEDEDEDEGQRERHTRAEIEEGDKYTKGGKHIQCQQRG